MAQQTFAMWLKAQRRLQGYKTQDDLARAVGVSERAIRYYESGKTPDPGVRAAIEQVLGEFAEGDPVEAAVRGSELHDWRQDDVLSTYKRHLHEQRREEAG